MLYKLTEIFNFVAKRAAKIKHEWALLKLPNGTPMSNVRLRSRNGNRNVIAGAKSMLLRKF